MDGRTSDRLVEPGTVLGSYRIERLLGRGGMGSVFLAHDTTLHRLVALKLLEGDQARSLVLREARNAAALNHSNICTIHEVGDAGGTPFIAMEYADGRSLRDRLDEGPLPVDDAVQYGIQAADALAYAHEHGVVHRDFKAANIIVTEAGRLKIVDFGLARRDDATLEGATTMASLVPAGVVAGTPYAMAPEQVRGEPADARSDVWALGVLLYELVSGGKPFAGASVPDMLSSILTKAPAPLRPVVPAALAAVIEKCLEKDPAQRFQGAAHVRDALAAFHSGAMARWDTLRYRLKGRRTLVAAASIVAIAALLVGMDVSGLRGWLASIFTASPIKLAVLPFENLTGDAEQEYLSDGLTDEMITQLGRLHPQRLRVIARTSSVRYKYRTAAVGDIGRDLGVDYVLEGSARREGSRVRISASLIQVRDQSTRWTDTFDRELAGVLSLQNDVARGVARALAFTLLPEQQNQLAAARPVNPDAYEAYLRGRSSLERLGRADLDAALRHFELALEKDPNYAQAHVGIASVWGTRQQIGAAPRNVARPAQKAALQKALDLDETLPEVHLEWAGYSAWGEWDWPAAEAHFRRALDLNPSFAEARAFYSQYLNLMKRRGEARAQIEQAIALDPLNPTVQTFFAQSERRTPEQAIARFRDVLKTTPNNGVALTGLEGALYSLGRHEEALAVQRQQARARGDTEMDEALAEAYAAGGYEGALRRQAAIVEERARSRNVARMPMVQLYLRLGEHERALDWLERAYEARDPNLPTISFRPIFDPLRGNPRFQVLLQRMKLPS